jgi:hypothetical protein
MMFLKIPAMPKAGSVIAIIKVNEKHLIILGLVIVLH